MKKIVVKFIRFSSTSFGFRLVLNILMWPQKSGFSPAMNLDSRSRYKMPKKFRERWGLKIAKFMTTSHEIDHSLREILYSQEEIDAQARRCFDKYGVFPISFSYPKNALVYHEATPRKHAFSSIIPGEAYAFANSDDYYQSYAESSFALTHKKIGWDCFRHVEIMSQGTVPIMPDVDFIPDCTMVHYPKEFFRLALNSFSEGLIPSQSVHSSISKWTQEHLTSISMAKYIIRMAEIEPKKILFIDQVLPSSPDYLSCMTLIGLKQLFGSAVHVAFQVDYIYEDYEKNTSSLYGKGFGYTKVLPRELKDSNIPTTELNYLLKNGEFFKEFDLVVIGSVSRNEVFCDLLDQTVMPGDKLYIWGDDRPRSRKELRKIVSIDGFKFIREIY